MTGLAVPVRGNHRANVARWFHELQHAHPSAIYAALALVLASIFVPMAMLRLIDADEGIYLFNTRLVMEGRLPYHEFHYPQMPLLLYVYGAWMQLVGISWYAGRLLSALFAIALGLALTHHVARVTGERPWGVLAAVLFALSGFAFGWLPLVKTYAFATLALFLACTVLESPWGRWRYFASGVLLGLGIDTRLYVLALLPVFGGAALRESQPRRALLKLFAGVALALLPNAYLFALGPDAFVFNVLGHHAIRSGFGLIGNFSQKLQVIQTLLGIELAVDGSSLQFTLVLVLWLCFVVSARRLGERLPCSVPIAVIVILVSLLPTPSYTQYFCMAMPFLIADAVRFVARLAADSEPSAGTLRVRLRHAIVVFVSVYVVAAAVAAHRYTVDGAGIPGIFTAADVRNWTIPTVNRVA